MPVSPRSCLFRDRVPATSRCKAVLFNPMGALVTDCATLAGMDLNWIATSRRPGTQACVRYKVRVNLDAGTAPTASYIRGYLSP
jgi:hypothetical protein